MLTDDTKSDENTDEKAKAEFVTLMAELKKRAPLKFAEFAAMCREQIARSKIHR